MYELVDAVTRKVVNICKAYNKDEACRKFGLKPNTKNSRSIFEVPPGAT